MEQSLADSRAKITLLNPTSHFLQGLPVALTILHQVQASEEISLSDLAMNPMLQSLAKRPRRRDERLCGAFDTKASVKQGGRRGAHRISFEVS
jgi:hypothetical protein